MRTLARWMLASAMVFAGVSHLFWARKEFQAQVPDFTTKVMDKDAVVVASGVVEIMLGASLVALPRSRRTIGAILGAFFVAVFPGNIHQWRTGRSVPGLDTDARRFGRLFLQPLLVAWALWCTVDQKPGGRGRRR